MLARSSRYIDGYKPRFNFQALLEQAVLATSTSTENFFEPLVNGPVLNPTASPDADGFDVSRVRSLRQRR
ncbi:MAG: hypothetical protein U0163_20225 [Gemmatimonadaceae bacterium]